MKFNVGDKVGVGINNVLVVAEITHKQDLIGFGKVKHHTYTVKHAEGTIQGLAEYQLIHLIKSYDNLDYHFNQF